MLCYLVWCVYYDKCTWPILSSTYRCVVRSSSIYLYYLLIDTQILHFSIIWIYKHRFIHRWYILQFVCDFVYIWNSLWHVMHYFGKGLLDVFDIFQHQRLCIYWLRSYFTVFMWVTDPYLCYSVYFTLSRLSHSLTHSHSFIHSFIHTFIHSLTHSHTHTHIFLFVLIYY